MSELATPVMKAVILILLLLVSGFATAMAIFALLEKDWPQACAWILLEISCTVTSVSFRK